MATPTAVFPAALATDAQLKVANNLVTTTLKVAATSTDAILFVNSTAGFVPNCLVSIDKEILSIGSVTSSPNPTLTVSSGGRGFDGTTAAQHSGGAKVSLFIDAWHHNALSSEIKAIEAALGPNLANVSSDPRLISTKYIFNPQTPGGTLTGGVANVVTLSPVPAGVNGTDVNHDLYISGGTGTAETVRITGGTAVAGAVSGTIIFTPANSHSGAWQIATATEGIQEAIVTGLARPYSRFDLYIPAGVYRIHGLVYLPSNGIARILGAGMSQTFIEPYNLTGPSIWLEGNGESILEFGEMMLSRSDTGAGTSDVGLLLNNWSPNAVIHHFAVALAYDGIQLNGQVTMNHVIVSDYQNTGIHGTGSRCGGTWIDVIVGSGMDSGAGSSAPYAVKIDTVVDGLYCSECTFGGSDYGVWVNPGTGYASNLLFSNVLFERYKEGGYVHQQNAGSQGGGIIKFDNCRFACRNTSSTSKGIFLISSGSSILLDGITVSNCLMEMNIWGIRLAGVSNTTIVGNTIFGSDLTTLPGQEGILFDAASGTPSANVTITGNTMGYGQFNSTTRGNHDFTAGPLDIAIHIGGGGSGPHQRVTIADNVLAGLSGLSIRVDQLPTGLVIANNEGIVNNFSLSIASAASINFLATAAPVFPFFTLTGSVAVTSVSGLWEGAQGMFLASSATPGAWTAGAAIGNTFTPQTNVPVYWQFRNGKIWLK